MPPSRPNPLFFRPPNGTERWRTCENGESSLCGCVGTKNHCMAHQLHQLQTMAHGGTQNHCMAHQLHQLQTMAHGGTQNHCMAHQLQQLQHAKIKRSGGGRSGVGWGGVRCPCTSLHSVQSGVRHPGAGPGSTCTVHDTTLHVHYMLLHAHYHAAYHPGVDHPYVIAM